jgi:hypothetical protein
MAGDSTTTGKPPGASTESPQTVTVPRAKSPTAAPPLASGSIAPSAVTPPRTVKCPKCGVDAREVARFCQRCHMTLRFTCPACKHEQRKGGSCEKCGVDFLKYITAVVDAKKDNRDAAHDRLERRSSFVKNILFIPLTGGLSLLSLLRPKKDSSK